jgi:carboxyl-terminal processing protease
MVFNKSATWARTIAIIVSVFFLTVAAFGLGVSVGTRNTLGLAPSPAAAADASSMTSGATGGAGDVLDMALFREAWGLLQKQFYGNLPSGKAVTYDAIQGVIQHLGDPHTTFLDPKNAALMNSDLEGHFEGIGARVEQAEGGGVLIGYLFARQPAEQTGLQVGDVITAVDAKDVTKLTLTEAIALIRGPGGSQVTLTIRRGSSAPFDVKVTRARIEIPVVESKTLAGGKVAYVALSEFNTVAPQQLADALQAALKQRPTGIILDLRGNPGGFLDAAVRIGSYFVPAGKVPGDNIVVERFKDGTQHDYQRQGDYLLGDTPLVVLVDAGSASASEIVAGAIQDAHTGILIGEKTYGKGSVQLVNALSDGSQLRVTVAHWFTPLDRGIHGAGLTPDVVIALTKDDVAAKHDPQLDQAVKYLLGDHTAPPTPTPTPAP